MSKDNETNDLGKPIVRVKGDLLKTLDLFRDNDDFLLFQRILLGTVDINPDTMKPVGGTGKVEREPATNADIIYTVTEKKIHVKQIVADMTAAVAVADRAFTITVQKFIGSTSVVINHTTGAVSLQSGQKGSITMLPGSPTTYLNDNGTITTEDTAITAGDGMILTEADIITIAATNKNAADRMRFQMFQEVDEP